MAASTMRVRTGRSANSGSAATTGTSSSSGSAGHGSSASTKVVAANSAAAVPAESVSVQPAGVARPVDELPQQQRPGACSERDAVHQVADRCREHGRDADREAEAERAGAAGDVVVAQAQRQANEQGHEHRHAGAERPGRGALALGHHAAEDPGARQADRRGDQPRQEAWRLGEEEVEGQRNGWRQQNEQQGLARCRQRRERDAGGQHQRGRQGGDDGQPGRARAAEQRRHERRDDERSDARLEHRVVEQGGHRQRSFGARRGCGRSELGPGTGLGPFKPGDGFLHGR